MSNLPAGIRSRARLAGVSDPDFVDVAGLYTRACDRCARGRGAQLRRMQVAKCAALLADRRPRRAQNDDLTARHNLSF